MGISDIGFWILVRIMSYFKPYAMRLGPLAFYPIPSIIYLILKHRRKHPIEVASIGIGT